MFIIKFKYSSLPVFRLNELNSILNCTHSTHNILSTEMDVLRGQQENQGWKE